MGCDISNGHGIGLCRPNVISHTGACTGQNSLAPGTNPCNSVQPGGSFTWENHRGVGSATVWVEQAISGL